MPVVPAEEPFAPRAEPQIAVAVGECVRRKVGAESLGLAIGSKCAFTPSAQASGSHPNPEVLLIIDKKRTNGVVSKAVPRGPVRCSIGTNTPDSVASRAYPEIALPGSQSSNTVTGLSDRRPSGHLIESI